MPKIAKTRNDWKFIKILGWVFGGIIGIFILASILFLTILEPAVEKFIKSQVTEKTDGLYSVTFRDIRLNLLTSKATFKDLTIIPDTSLYFQREDMFFKNLVYVEVPNVHIAGIGFIEALLFNKFRIKEIFLEKPIITILADDKSDDKMEASKKNEIFQNLQIGAINISDGRLKYQQLKEKSTLHLIPKFSVFIQGIGINPDKDPVIGISNMQFSINDYTYYSTEIGYKFSIGMIDYSTQKKELVVDKIEVHPLQKYSIISSESLNSNIYKVNVPGVRISGLDFSEAYQFQKLALDKILVNNPQIEVLHDIENQETKEELSVTNLYNDFKQYYDTVTINAISIKEGNLKIQQQTDKIHTIHLINGFDIFLENIHLDSGTMLVTNKLFMDDMQFKVNDYSFSHPESPYSLEVRNLFLSTKEKSIETDSIILKGEAEKNEILNKNNKGKDILYGFSAPHLKINGVEILQAINTARLDIDNIIIEQPHLEVWKDRNIINDRNQQELKELYNAANQLVERINIDEIILSDASFKHQIKNTDRKVRRVQQLKHANITARGLVIDSGFVYQQNMVLPLESIEFHANDYKYVSPDFVHVFSLDQLQYDSKKEVLSAKTIKIDNHREINQNLIASGNANRNLFDVHASQFLISGLNFINAINSGKLEVDQIVLRNPDLDIFLDRNIAKSTSGPPREEIIDDLFSIFNLLAVNSLALESGAFSVREKRDEEIRTHLLEHASAKIDNIILTRTALNNYEEKLPFKDIILLAKDYHYQSPDNIYSVQLDSMVYSSNLQVLSANLIKVNSDKAENERLKSLNTNIANRNLFDISADKFRLSGFDLVHAYASGEFSVDELLINEPEIVVLQDRDVPPRPRNNIKKDNEIREQLSDVVKIFNIQNLNIIDGTINFTILNNEQSQHIIEHVSLFINQLRLASLETNDPLEMFMVSNMELVVKDFSYVFPDSLYTFNLGQVHLSLMERTLQIDDIHLIPLFTIDEYPYRLDYVDDRFDLAVASLKMQNVNFLQMFNNQEVFLEKALLKDVKLEIYRDERLERDPERRPKTLQSLLKKAQINLHADTVVLEKGEISFSSIPLNGEEPVFLLFENTFIQMVNISNDSVSLVKNNIATIEASSNFMGAGKLQVEFQLHLDHTDDLYSYDGSLEPMKLDELNPLFENMFPVKIEEGKINKIEFNVSASEHVAEGEMRFFYNDLSIQLVDKDNPQNPNFWLRTGSWLINNFMIKSHNPTKRGKFRVGTIQVDRNYKRSVFNHMGESMIDGISSSIMTPFVEKVVDAFVNE